MSWAFKKKKTHKENLTMAFFLLLKINFIEVYFWYNKTYSFKYFNFKEFCQMCGHITTSKVKVRNVYYPKKFFYSPFQLMPSCYFILLLTNDIIVLPFLEFYMKKNYTICSLLNLTSFTEHNVFEIHPCCHFLLLGNFPL